MAKVRELSPKALEVLEVLKGATEPMTLADLKEKVDGLNASHLTALANRDLVSTDKVEKEVVTVTKRKVNTYAFAPVDVAEGE